MAWSPMSSPDDTSHGIDDKLVYMANQIGKFFKAQNMDTAAAKIAEHITKFWDPRMRQAIVAHLDAGGAGLDTTTRRAVETGAAEILSAALSRRLREVDSGSDYERPEQTISVCEG
jgi:formate dehydrogenase subunit delta